MSSKPFITLEQFKPTAGDGTDDTQAYLSAKAVSMNSGLPLQFLNKMYNFDHHVPMHEHGIKLNGLGVGPRFVNEGENFGTILNSRVVTGIGFDFGGIGSTCKNIRFRSVTTGICLNADVRGMSVLSNCSIQTRNAAIGLKLNKAYTCIIEVIDVVNLDQNQQGVGLYQDTHTVGLDGGLIDLNQITATHYDTNLSLGQQATARNPRVFWRKANILRNCQGRYGNTNLLIGSGYGSLKIQGFWGEGTNTGNNNADIQILGGAGPISIENSIMQTPGSKGLVIGNPTDFGFKPVYPVTVKESEFKITAGGIRIHPSNMNPVLDGYHEFDNCTFTKSGDGKILVSDRVEQMKVKISRPLLAGYSYSDVSELAYDSNDLAYPELTASGGLW